MDVRPLHGTKLLFQILHRSEIFIIPKVRQKLRDKWYLFWGKLCWFLIILSCQFLSSVSLCWHHPIIFFFILPAFLFWIIFLPDKEDIYSSVPETYSGGNKRPSLDRGQILSASSSGTGQTPFSAKAIYQYTAQVTAFCCFLGFLFFALTHLVRKCFVSFLRSACSCFVSWTCPLSFFSVFLYMHEHCTEKYFFFYLC